VWRGLEERTKKIKEKLGRINILLFISKINEAIKYENNNIDGNYHLDLNRYPAALLRPGQGIPTATSVENGVMRYPAALLRLGAEGSPSSIEITDGSNQLKYHEFY
jgi:hypothetical protein